MITSIKAIESKKPKVLIDSNAINFLLKESSLKQKILCHELILLITSTLIDELIDKSETDSEGGKRLVLELCRLPFSLVSSTAVVDESVVGYRHIASKKTYDIYLKVKDHCKSMRDGIYAADAFYHNASLITDDKELFNAAKNCGLHVKKPSEF